ncbi:hypothetical protein SAMN05444287_1001 [Octadecabacter temperatus]|uniref:Uncharacterized protein n=1 Tax=Octadecabacter temperatus TaxID=1458307 RepID=A0A0K0Y4H6_9RHOB|nr:hypothetical protein [Octadecabacter temperatus]AKS45898.1 hypothetical protein OSB_13450 [Octadecabacter temperatus]SIO03033.1 hypothetical protein SAMN05444287_1001 [Octadecabacter temperatus]
MSELRALITLQALDAVIGPDGQGGLEELSTWATPGERMEHRRGRIEAVALSGMALGEIHLFLARAAQDATQSWNREQSVFGRIHNLMTTRFPGYAQVPGRILIQVMEAIGSDVGELAAPASLYLLRADVVVDLRDQVAALRKDAA